jgi:multidrug resistance efflux pump
VTAGGRSRRALPALVLAALALAACKETGTQAGTGERAPGSGSASPTAANAASQDFQGFVIAHNAVDAFAPEFVFKVAGWSSDWGQRKIVELAPDGKEVAAGDVVARFEFGQENVQRQVKETIQGAQSDLMQRSLAARQVLDAQESALRRLEMEAQLAALNLERKPALSRLQGESLSILHRMALFEVDAARRQLVSTRLAKAAERSFDEQKLAHAEESLARYEFYRDRFSLRAPQAGVVRHAFSGRMRRKLQKGDNVWAGVRIVSIAKDAELAVRFFVPEARAATVSAGAQVSVVSPASGEAVAGVIERVAFFPQELGFLLENDSLPDAREKALVVRAVFRAPPPASITAGTEVRVRLVAGGETDHGTAANARPAAGTDAAP